MVYKSNIIDSNLGPVFPQPVMIGGLVFAGFGIILLFQIWYMGILMIVLGGYVGIGVNGVCIDTTRMMFKTYTKWLGIRNGRWKSLESYPFLSVIKWQVGITMASRGNRTLDMPETTFCVCLLSSTHRTKVVIRQEDSFRQAEKFAKETAGRLGKAVVEYSPVISEQTRARR